jgi:hypothetical protein
VNADRARDIFRLIEDLCRQAARHEADPQQVLHDVAHHAARGRLELETAAPPPRVITFADLEAQFANAGAAI